jgi:hypothetical protein
MCYEKTLTNVEVFFIDIGVWNLYSIVIYLNEKKWKKKEKFESMKRML